MHPECSGFYGNRGTHGTFGPAAQKAKHTPRGPGEGGIIMGDNPSSNTRIHQDIGRLLARTPVVDDACSLDLLVFLYRHPRTLLTNEQVATFVGHEMKVVAKSIDSLIALGLLERTQNPAHAARMYRLMLESPTTGGLEALLELASTRQGRRDILEVLALRRSGRPVDRIPSKRKLSVVA